VIGAHLAGGAKITCEVVRKEPGDKGGPPCRVDGVPQVVESFRFPPSFDEDTLPLFNVNSFVFDAEAIDRDFDLTFFRVEKKVDGAKVIQFERLVGQATAFLPTRAAWCEGRLRVALRALGMAQRRRSLLDQRAGARSDALRPVHGANAAALATYAPLWVIGPHSAWYEPAGASLRSR